MSTLDQRLIAAVGEENVLKDPAKISSFFRQPVEKTGLRALLPEKVEEVQSIVKLAREERLPVFTTYDSFFRQEVSSHKAGLLIDFRRMNKIERMEPRGMVVHVQRGVTYEQLTEETKKNGIKLLPAAAATSRSVVEQSVNRAVNLRAARFPDATVANMKVVLADGRIHLTGTHALSEEGANVAHDGSADLSRWYVGADDMFGIVTRATINVYPIWEERKVCFFGFEQLEGACALIRDIPRHEWALENIALNKKALARLAGINEKGLPPWVAVIGLEGKKKLVDYYEKQVYDLVGRKGASNLTSKLGESAAIIERPWYAIDQPCLGFYTTFKRIGEFDEVIEASLKDAGSSLDDVSRKVISVASGGAVWLGYDLPAEMCEKVGVRLVDRGAFFDRPTGKLSEAVYSKMDAFVRHVKRIKNMMDPGNLLNPGIPF